MTHEIERNEHYVGGESVVWEYTIVNEDEVVRDITGATVEWYLLNRRGEDNSEAVLSHDDSGVSASVQAGTQGYVEVEIQSGVTDELAGDLYWQRLIVTEVNGRRQIWNGPFPIQER
jgi:hypothetical protein